MGEWRSWLESRRKGRNVRFLNKIKYGMGLHFKKQENRSLKNLLPVEVVFKQEFPDMATARKVEARLKRLKRKDYLERIIKDRKINLGS